MQVIDWKDLPNFDKSYFGKGTAISIGGFDGLHIGHQSLLNKLKIRAEEKKLAKGIVTFYFPPKYVFASEKGRNISSIRLKLAKLEKMGFDFVILVDFSLDFAKMSGYRFVESLKKNINVEYVVVGRDFRFGCERKSSIEDMRLFASEFSFCFEVFDDIVCENGERISSSSIRVAVFEGALDYAERLLGGAVDIDILNISPCKRLPCGVVFEKKDIIQVLPCFGEFGGELFFLPPMQQKECVKVFFDKDFFEIGFENFELNEAELRFDMLRLQSLRSSYGVSKRKNSVYC